MHKLKILHKLLSRHLHNVCLCFLPTSTSTNLFLFPCPVFSCRDGKIQYDPRMVEGAPSLSTIAHFPCSQCCGCSCEVLYCRRPLCNPRSSGDSRSQTKSCDLGERDRETGICTNMFTFFTHSNRSWCSSPLVLRQEVECSEQEASPSQDHI